LSGVRRKWPGGVKSRSCKQHGRLASIGLWSSEIKSTLNPIVNVPREPLEFIPQYPDSGWLGVTRQSSFERKKSVVTQTLDRIVDRVIELAGR